MALTVYQRGDYYWVRGFVRDRPLRRSLHTKNREVAHTRAAKIELGMEDGLDPVPLRELPQRYLSRYTSESTLRHRRYTVAALTAAVPKKQYLHEITALELEEFLRRPSRRGGARSPNSIRQEISRLRAIWAWGVRVQAVRTNIAAALKMPPERPSVTLPFTREELAKLERAIEELDREPSLEGRGLTARTRAMFEVFRCTGIRVSDLVKLRPADVAGGKLDIVTKKAGTRVQLKLLPAAKKALDALPVQPSGYWFWSGESFDIACTTVWQVFRRLGKRAGVERCHPHRFRDTFAVHMLQSGADLRLVSRLLGHQSIAVTERHYAPWVAAFQAQADQAIEAAERLYRSRRQPARPAGKKKRPKKKAAR